MKTVNRTALKLLVPAWILGFGLISAWAFPPQATPGKPSAPGMIQTGYVVITPTSANTAGLVAFETFGERRGPDMEQAGVLPSIMTTNSALFVSASGRLSRNLGVAVANPSGNPANITLSLRDNTGKVLATTGFALAAHQQTARFVTQLFASSAAVPSDLTGTLAITSDIPVAVVGLRFRGLNFSTEPATILGPASGVPVISTGVGGPAAVILAHFAVGGGWASEIVMANVSAAELTVRVDLFANDGTPLSTTLNNQTGSSFVNISIPAGGVATLAPLDVDGDSGF